MNVLIQPRQVRLELTNHCPAHCWPCHRNLMTRPLGFMSMSLVEKCLKDIRQFPSPLTEVVPTGWGEAFFHPQWQEILMLISRYLPRTTMVLPTNGTLLVDSMADKLAQVPTLKLVNFSVNVALPATYEAYFKLPASKMEIVEKAIVRLKQLRPDIAIWISMVRESRLQSPREVELFQEKWSKYGAVQISQAEYAGVPGREPITPVTLPCRSLFSDLVVLYDGACLSCCYVADKVEELVIGDAMAENLLDIWHGKLFTELRQKHLSGKRAEVKLCSSCTFS